MANLITLDNYKLLEGINSSDNDDKLELLITSVSKLIRNYCGTDFDSYVGSPGITELFDIQWPTHIVQLSEIPVLEVTGVYERLGQADAYIQLYKDGENGSYDWYFESTTDSIIRTSPSGAYMNWPRGVGAVKVTYTAGYATIPSDLMLAAGDLVTYYFKNEHKATQTIGSTTKRGDRPTAVPSVTGLPDHIRRVLDMYKDV